MPFTSLVMLLVLFLVLIFLVVGVTLHRKQRNTQNKPSLLGISSLFLQLALFVLFFTGVLTSFNEVFVDILWWGIVICGLAIGIKEIKTNVIVSMLTIFLSILLAIFMLLMLVITSM